MRMKSIDSLPFTHSFGALPAAFHTRLMPTPLAAPYLVCSSPAVARLIGLDPDELTRPAAIEALAGNRVPQGAAPLAAVYSGHQFGVWAGQLGDGRAILLGGVATSTGTLELQLKGAGPTPYSRMGDGRAVLRSSIREFLCSEAMAGLGIPTSRALCVTGSKQLVMREAPESVAVATRVAPSFVRFGSFEHWYYKDRPVELQQLADYVIDHFYPELRSGEHAQGNPYRALLSEVSRRTAVMIAHWQAVGFMHGVMNTDNMSILGLTIDYGPFGFMEAFDAGHICNHTDQQGRYAFHRQPEIGQWNCYALGQALLPLIGSVEETTDALAVYQPTFMQTLDTLFHAKLGLLTQAPQDKALIDDLLALLQANHTDYPLFWRRLGDLQIDQPQADAPLRDLFLDRPAFDQWAQRYRSRLQSEQSRDPPRKQQMDRVNPKYVLRNYLAQIAIEKAQNGDFSEVAKLLSVLENPYDEHPDHAAYAALPPDWANDLEVSCSS